VGAAVSAGTLVFVGTAVDVGAKVEVDDGDGVGVSPAVGVGRAVQAHAIHTTAIHSHTVLHPTLLPARKPNHPSNRV
jgi:hypothetical protein